MWDVLYLYTYKCTTKGFDIAKSFVSMLTIVLSSVYFFYLLLILSSSHKSHFCVSRQQLVIREICNVETLDTCLYDIAELCLGFYNESCKKSLVIVVLMFMQL